MASAASALLSRSFSASCGATANGTTSARSTWNFKSGMRSPCRNQRLAFQFLEEVRNLLPDFCTAGEPFPVQANQADQLEALIDGQDVVLRRGKSTGMSDTVYQKSFDVRFHGVDVRIVARDLRPGFQ